MPLNPEHAPPAPSWVPPTEFDEFRLVRVLGRGAMGVVYLAHDLSLDRQVAVKFIATTQPDAQARANFQVEARAIARLQHPNVVTVFRVGEVEGHPYLVSEYLIGQSLAELALPLLAAAAGITPPNESVLGDTGPAASGRRARAPRPAGEPGRMRAPQAQLPTSDAELMGHTRTCRPRRGRARCTPATL